MELKKKSPEQLEALRKLFAEEKYPTNDAIEELAESLNLTVAQVRGWFCEKRRKEKSKKPLAVTPIQSKKLSTAKGRKVLREGGPFSHVRANSSSSLSSEVEDGITERSSKLARVQQLHSSEYIMSTVFRKDGPALGVEFDSVPSRGFHTRKESINYLSASKDDEATIKKRKHVEDCTLSELVKKHGAGKGLMRKNAKDCSIGVPTMKHGMGKGLMRKSQDYTVSSPRKKHGTGKGLMTAWHGINRDGIDFPIDRQRSNIRELPTAKSCILRRQDRKRQPTSVMEKVGEKLKEKRKASFRRKEVGSEGEETEKQLFRETCELALDGRISQEHLNQFALLMDDEEVEMRELQAGPNPLTCSEHCAANGLHSCSLCKDMLPKFPPDSVHMKQPFSVQPWECSSETVKKLFKVLHFLYTYSVTIDISSFTLDAFAQAFHDKDSLLLGKIHVALLKLLFSDVERDISNGFLPHLSISCKFLALLHSVEDQEFVVDFWKSSLNPLTWTEILRQVLVAAGFGSKQGAFRRQALSKEMRLMLKYGLTPGTLKGELFRLLFEKGKNGMKISELVKSAQVAKLNLASTNEELELLISSALSSDITLFEKISLAAYRLRVSTLLKEDDSCHSDSEDSGSIHDDFNDAADMCSSSDSDCDSESLTERKLRHLKCRKSKNNKLTVHNEIDESHPGEVWLLGLMDGEYSDLSIDEKLDVLVALIDLVSAGSSIRMEDPVRPAPNLQHYGSGAKIKRSSLHRPSWVHEKQIFHPCSSSKSQPVDSSVSIFNFRIEDISSCVAKVGKETESVADLHRMQSVFLGSDRRYNQYWLFLGPCDFHDPGHKRVYFESSEDGHWKVIDTAEALRSLLSVLDDRGRREAQLIKSLEKRETFLCKEMSNVMRNNAASCHSAQSSQSELTVREDSLSPISGVEETTNDLLSPRGAIVLNAERNLEEENPRLDSLQLFDSWIWDNFYRGLKAVKHSKRSFYEHLTRCQKCHDLYWRDEKHCRICHLTFEVDFDLEEKYAVHTATCRMKDENENVSRYKVLPSVLQTLKAGVHAIESAMPEGALVGAWTKSAHRLWVKRLRRTSSLTELLQVVTDFVAAINEDWLYQTSDAPGFNPFTEEIVVCFSSMPQTSSALALWLVKLDDLIWQHSENTRCQEEETAIVIR